MIERELLEKVKEWDIMVRRGQGNRVAAAIQKISLSNIPRNHVAALANLSRRVGYSNFSLKLLFPIVRPQVSGVRSPSTLELAEYGAALADIGAISEAQKVLSEIKVDGISSRVWLFQAFTYFRTWDYEAALPFLEKFVAAQTDDYQKSIGSLNLAAAQIICDKLEEAAQTLENVLKISYEQANWLLYGNALELQGQLNVKKESWKKAEQVLLKSTEFLAGASPAGLLYAKKWLAVAKVKQKKAQAVHEFSAIIKEAQNIGEWETIRDCERHRALITKNELLFNKVYFGTPHEAFRKKLRLAGSAQGLTIYPCYHWESEGNNQAKNVTIDLIAGQDLKKKIKLKTGQAMHRLLLVLCSDFYKPFSQGELFGRVFPGQYHDPFSSPDRVYQCVRRLQKWFGAKKIGLEILGHQQEYRINLSKQVAILKTDSRSGNLRGLRLQNHFSVGEFSARDLAQKESVSLRSANRILSDLLAEGLVEKVNQGPRTRFRMPG